MSNTASTHSQEPQALPRISFYRKIRKSAAQGAFSKVFNTVYLLAVFVYVFFSSITYSGTEYALFVIPSTLASIICGYVPVVLFWFSLVVGLCEGRRIRYWVVFLGLFVLEMTFNMDLRIVMPFVFAYPRGLKLEYVAKVMFGTIAAVILLIIFQCCVGAIPDITGERDGMIRHSLGFLSPNGLSIVVTASLIPYVFIRLPKWRWYDAAFCLLAGVAAYIVAAGRMSLVMVLVLVLLACLSKVESIRSVFCFIAPWAVVGCFALTMALTFVYWQNPDSAFSVALNEFASGRPYFIASYYNQYSLSIFAQPLEIVTASMVNANPSLYWRGIDCSYVWLFMGSGLAASIIVMGSFTWFGMQIKRGKRMYLAVTLLIVAIFSITENLLLRPSQDVMIFALGLFVAAWGNGLNVIKEPLRIRKGNAVMGEHAGFDNISPK